jgi:UDP-glucose 4-epimerase
VATLGERPVRALVRKRVDYLPPDSQVEVDLAGDPRHELVEAFAGASAVVHLAGHNEVVSAAEPDRALGETVVLSRHVADAARAAGVPRLVYVSTVHVYGARMLPGAVLTEEVPAEPRSTYAVARLASEHLIAEAGAGDVDVVVLRLTNAVGAPVDAAVDRWSLVALDLCREAARRGTLTLRTPGLQWRDFVDLGGVCRVLVGCAGPNAPAPGTYNLGSGRPTTVRALAELIRQRFEVRTGRAPELVAPAADGPAPAPYVVDVERLAAAGWRVDAPLTEPLDELIEFCTENEDRL